MRALLLAGLVAWLAGAGGQARHPYTLWTDGDTQVGNNHHTLSGKPLLQLSYLYKILSERFPIDV